MRTKEPKPKSLRVYRRNFKHGSNGKFIEVKPTLLVDRTNEKIAALAILQDVGGKHYGRQYMIGNSYRGIKYDSKAPSYKDPWSNVLVEAKHKLAIRMLNGPDPFRKNNIVVLPTGGSKQAKAA